MLIDVGIFFLVVQQHRLTSLIGQNDILFRNCFFFDFVNERKKKRIENLSLNQKCLFERFVPFSQRMDLGECPKVHDLALRADFDAASKKKDYYYDIEVQQLRMSHISFI